ncbi:hypothetical protein BT96DRAFT_1022616 [Gymnopus androsaceus JB14]|uniref:Uncharacterized protein n=1 Tax=Gymnopus androsaceus JB14 TaxID=1447944 RepID=A0A6A4H8F1_9AGAR|nr:hypothetical protein BT96DRAFT_1022616 [Gymnopus androsaceus JB14]
MCFCSVITRSFSTECCNRSCFPSAFEALRELTEVDETKIVPYLPRRLECMRILQEDRAAAKPCNFLRLFWTHWSLEAYKNMFRLSNLALVISILLFIQVMTVQGQSCTIGASSPDPCPSGYKCCGPLHVVDDLVYGSCFLETEICPA